MRYLCDTYVREMSYISALSLKTFCLTLTPKASLGLIPTKYVPLPIKIDVQTQKTHRILGYHIWRPWQLDLKIGSRAV